MLHVTSAGLPNADAILEKSEAQGVAGSHAQLKLLAVSALCLGSCCATGSSQLTIVKMLLRVSNVDDSITVALPGGKSYRWPRRVLLVGYGVADCAKLSAKFCLLFLQRNCPEVAATS